MYAYSGFTQQLYVLNSMLTTTGLPPSSTLTVVGGAVL